MSGTVATISWRRALAWSAIGGLIVVVRLAWMLLVVHRPSADDVVYAMMGEAIRRGQEAPLLAWGIGYGGTLGTSWILAACYAVTGPSWVVTMAYAALLACLQVVVWSALAEQCQPGAGWWTALLLAVLPPALAPSAQALSYCEAPIIGGCLLWLALRVVQSERPSPRLAYGLGAVTGYALYVHPIALPFLGVWWAVWRRRTTLAWRPLLFGVCLGVSPLLLANILRRGITLRRIGSRFLNANATDFRQHGSLQWMFERCTTQLIAGVRLQGHVIQEALSAPACSWVWGGLAACALGWLIWRARRAPLLWRRLMWPVLAANLLSSIGLGVNARSRYYLPAYFTTMLWAGTSVALGGAPAVSVATGLTAWNAWQTVRAWRALPPPAPYAATIQWLRTQGLREGYGDYWTALPLTFLSRGAVVVSSRGTDAAGVFDRTVAVTRRVDHAPVIFYIFHLDYTIEREFAEKLERHAQEAGITFQKTVRPPFVIYWQFSRPIRPNELPPHLWHLSR